MTALKPYLRHWHRYRQQLRQGWEWWQQQLLQLCPDGLRQRLISGQTPGYLLINGDHYELLSHPDALDQPLLQVESSIEALPSALRQQLSAYDPLVILIPDSLVLRAPVQLPAVAAQHINRVIDHQLPQLTPFAPDQVYVAHQRQPSDPETLRLELQLVPKALVDIPLMQLRRWGLECQTLRPLSMAQRSGYSLLPPAPVSQRPLRQLNRLLLASNLLLLLALSALPLWQKQQQIHTLEAERNQLRASAEAVLETRQQLDLLIQVQQQLQQRRDQPGQHLPTLASLTEQLPDSAWLNQLSWQQNTLTLQGEADNASALISQLDQAGGFSQVEFGTPVTRNPDNGKERFSINLQLNTEATP